MGVHGAARRGLQPLRHQCLLDRRGVLLKLAPSLSLAGYYGLSTAAPGPFYDRGQLIERFLD